MYIIIYTHMHVCQIYSAYRIRSTDPPRTSVVPPDPPFWNLMGFYRDFMGFYSDFHGIL